MIRLIHGIHSKEGDNNMSRLHAALLPFFGERLHLFEYGFMGFWQARWRNDLVARWLADASEPGEVWLTHSNGAAIAYLAVTKYGAKPSCIININPALDRWKTAPVDHVVTIHSSGDRAVWWSQWLPFHIWGDQGKVGYRGKAENTHNINASENDSMHYEHHCGMFDPAILPHWAAYLRLLIYQRLGS